MVTLHAKLQYSSERTSFASKKMILKIKEEKLRYLYKQQSMICINDKENYNLFCLNNLQF